MNETKHNLSCLNRMCRPQKRLFKIQEIWSNAASKMETLNGKIQIFLVSGRDLACQQEVSLALTKTPPVHYYNVVDSAFSNNAA